MGRGCDERGQHKPHQRGGGTVLDVKMRGNIMSGDPGQVEEHDPEIAIHFSCSHSGRILSIFVKNYIFKTL